MMEIVTEPHKANKFRSIKHRVSKNHKDDEDRHTVALNAYRHAHKLLDRKITRRQTEINFEGGGSDLREGNSFKKFVVKKSMRRSTVLEPDNDDCAAANMYSIAATRQPAPVKPAIVKPEMPKKRIKKYRKRELPDTDQSSQVSGSMVFSFGDIANESHHKHNKRVPHMNRLGSYNSPCCEKKKADLMAFVTLLYYYLVNRGPEECTEEDVLHLIMNELSSDIRIGRHVMRAKCINENWRTILFKYPPKASSDTPAREDTGSTWLYISKTAGKHCPEDQCACKTSQGHLRISKSSSGKQLEFFTLDWKGRGSMRVFTPIT